MPKMFAIAALLLATAATAQPGGNDAGVPAPLRDWRSWALADLDYRACPFLATGQPDAEGRFVCAWPGRLALATTGEGAAFSIRWRAEAQSWIALPGDADHWPQQVSVNGQRQPVLVHDDRPALRLGPGSHDIVGRIPWRERPQALTVPQSVGLIALTIDGKAVLPVQRDGEQVTLGRATAAAPEADSITLRVYRKLGDGVPALLETRIVVAVSGQAREEAIGPVLPAGFTPIELGGNWPARLDADGRLRVQVQPGNETLTLTARATAPLTAVAAHLPAAPWPTQEIWSYGAAPRLRVTVAGGTVQIDPRQAEVPDEWSGLPAFALADGARLAVEERSRGLAPDEANRLNLQREAWLDFDGNGWYARDRVLGTMATGWRLDVAAPYVLERATALNSRRQAGGEPLLITRGAKPDSSGVEWRAAHVELGAGLRLSDTAAAPVAGWQQTFDSVSATLHFPFGYKLLAAPGADAASGSWASAWTLLDAFVCAIVVLLAWRLLGTAAAAVVGAFLLLAYQESGAPLWSLVAALALALVARALPAGRLRAGVEWARRAALLLLVLVTLPFVTTQLRDALYPQLEAGGFGGYAMPVAGGFADKPMRQAATRNMPAAPPATAETEEATAPAEARADSYATLETPAPPPAPRAKINAKDERKAAKSASLDNIVVTGSRIDRSLLIDHYAETTLVQTGRGAPSWNLGSTAWLSWSGPVLATQTARLLIAPPWLVRTLRLVLVALLAFVLWSLFGGSARVPRGGMPVAAALLAGGLAFGSNAQAQSFPSPELLQQLRARLTEVPKCAPQCAHVAVAEVNANGDRIGIALEAHAGERVALPLPEDAADATLQSIQVDGSADESIMRSDDGRLWIAVSRGVHRIQLDFTARGDKAAFAFPLPPARVLFQGKGWDASGLADDRLQTETLTLARARDEAAGSASDSGTQQFPPYVQVTRSLTLGLQWSAHTSVRRLAPAYGGFTVALPLLGGEHASTAGLKVQDGKAQVAIADKADEAYWDSVLDKADALTLTAPALADHAEVWTVLVSPTWHVEFAGVPMISAMADDDADDYRNFEFHPLPGETLTLRITRPAAAQGAQRAIESVALHSEAGQRAMTHVLSFVLRASQGGEQAIALPKDAEVLAVQRDGIALNLRPLDGRLSLPVLPGAQSYEVRLRSAEPIGTVTRTPPITLGQPAANVHLTLALPGDRWLLAAFGPAVGPAVLYWGELLVMIGVAFALARTRRTKLRFRDWLLLGLGFSTFSWLALLVVVVWLFAFDWRARAALPAARWRFNLVQIALVVLAGFALFALVAAIPQGLLGQPDMHVTGYGSSAYALQWFADRSTDALPVATAISAPLWLYKVLMLIWAVWLANALIGWLRTAFAAWTRDGYWRARPAVPAAAPAETATDAAAP